MLNYNTWGNIFLATWAARELILKHQLTALCSLLVSPVLIQVLQADTKKNIRCAEDVLGETHMKVKGRGQQAEKRGRRSGKSLTPQHTLKQAGVRNATGGPQPKLPSKDVSHPIGRGHR